jgi:VWFA-related protein
MIKFSLTSLGTFLTIFLSLVNHSVAQPPETKKKSDNKVRTMTIPITIFSKQELKENQPEEFIEAGNIIVKEDNEEQVILSIKSVSQTPMALAILIQENLSSSFNLELKKLAEFIKHLPKGSRVMVAYLRGGSIQVRQKFTEDLEKVSNSLRIVTSSSASAPSGPYEGVREALNKFDSLPSGRRAILLVSDGLDISEPSPTQSIELERAILNAQRKSVAVYSFYSSTSFTENGGRNLSFLGQSSLNRLSEETGGRAFFQGTFSPVSFEPFFKDLSVALNRQFSLTYLSTHMNKGFHKVQVLSTNPHIKIEHPQGYVYR